ncbi:septum site-determining protein MinC, partial [Enterocloster asparagiformis]
MRNAVVIKSSKAGMTVILDDSLPFDELLAAIGTKFRESARFWGSVQMTLTLEGRELTPEEEFLIVDTITRNSQVEILCLLDTDAERIERCEKALNDKLMELNSQTGQFYRGSLKKGDSLESEASIVVIGDVDHGARIIAKGNIIVLGELKGTAAAGMAGNR